jgi:hypothetical protein
MLNSCFIYNFAKAGLENTKILDDEVMLGVSSQLLGPDGKGNLKRAYTLPVAYCSIETSTYLYQSIFSGLHEMFTPAEILRVATYEQLQVLVRMGQAIALYPAKLSNALRDRGTGISYFPLYENNNQTCEFDLIYKFSNRKAILRQAINYYQKKRPV